MRVVALTSREIDPALDSVFGGESARGNDAVTFVTLVRCFLRRRELVSTSGPERFADRVAYDYESQKRSSCCRFGRVSRTITFSRSHSLTSSRTRLSPGKCTLDGETIEAELLAEFKTALDQTRHSVWALLDGLAGYSGYTVEEVLQNYRMQRASELLHALRGQVQSAAVPESAAARTFMEEVQIVAELALRRHMR